MAKAKNIAIVVFNDDMNQLKFVIEVLSSTFGYHPTQAYQCAEMIHNRGSYIVKTLPEKHKEKAEAYRNMLVMNGLITKIIPI